MPPRRRNLIKKFYLYHQERTKLHGFEFVFDDEFDSYAKASAAALNGARKGLWLVWKIEEVFKFNPGTK